MSEDTRQRIIDACFESLREEGFTKTTARSVAGRGGFNSALIFYYFGTLESLFLAVLDQSSAQRMRSYAELVGRADTTEELVEVAREIYREDLDSGHITVFSELVAASLSRPQLAEEIVGRAEPWLDLVEQAIHKALGDTPIEALAPPRELARLVITLYLGINMFSRMDPDGAGMDSLFDLAGRTAPLLALLKS